MKTNRICVILVILLIMAVGCDQTGQSDLEGIITQVELGKDGVQVALQTDDLLYSVTINAMQTDIIGSFDQIVVGAEIEVSGHKIAGMDPPLIVADYVRMK